MRCRMKKTNLFALGIVVWLFLLGNLEARAAGCDPIGNVRFICDQIGPEDLVAVSGSEWLLSSGMAANGAIRLINVRDKTTPVLFPSATSKERPNKKIYDSCPGPIGSEGDKFRAHGLYLRPGQNAVHTLYVVHHGGRESMFSQPPNYGSFTLSSSTPIARVVFCFHNGGSTYGVTPFSAGSSLGGGGG